MTRIQSLRHRVVLTVKVLRRGEPYDARVALSPGQCAARAIYPWYKISRLDGVYPAENISLIRTRWRIAVFKIEIDDRSQRKAGILHQAAGIFAVRVSLTSIEPWIGYQL